jgi:hypothetical protein
MEFEEEGEEFLGSIVRGIGGLLGGQGEEEFELEGEMEFEEEGVSMSPALRRELAGILPGLIRGAAVITRLLCSQPTTRPMVRVVPTVVDQTARTLVRRQRRGRPVTPVIAGRVMGRQVARTLASPRRTTRAVGRNVVAARRAPIRRAQPQRADDVRRAGEEELEFEGEEEFFRRIMALVRRAAPVLRTVARTAGPLVATAVGGPVAGMAARALTSRLGCGCSVKPAAFGAAWPLRGGWRHARFSPVVALRKRRRRCWRKRWPQGVTR